MPLLELASHLNSTCNLKSSNLESLISSGPFPGVIKFPFSTFHTFVPEPFIFHPLKSLPLNKGIGFPHLGSPVGFKAGGFRPVHCQAFPSGPFTVPDSVFPTIVPSKTISASLASSSFGETKVSLCFESSCLGSGLASPQRPTMSAFNCPPSRRTSSHDGYSRSGAFSVKSQRPRKASADSPEGDEDFSDGF